MTRRLRNDSTETAFDAGGGVSGSFRGSCASAAADMKAQDARLREKARVFFMNWEAMRINNRVSREFEKSGVHMPEFRCSDHVDGFFRLAQVDRHRLQVVQALARVDAHGLPDAVDDRARHLRRLVDVAVER